MLASGTPLRQDVVRNLCILKVSTYLVYLAHGALQTKNVTTMAKSTDERLDEISIALNGLVASLPQYVTYKSLVGVVIFFVATSLGGVWAINKTVIGSAVADIQRENKVLIEAAKTELSESIGASFEELQSQITQQTIASEGSMEGSFRELNQRLDMLDERLNDIVFRLSEMSDDDQTQLEPFTPRVMPTDEEEEGTPNTRSVFEVASQIEDLQTLVSAWQSVELEQSFEVDGPFTIFAPSNEAFANLPEELVQIFLSNPDLLKMVLSYHVVAGEVTSEQLRAGFPIVGIDGNVLSTTMQEVIQVDGANIIQTDIQGSDGIIHIIDRVLMLDSLE